jgi:hypothetical protein
MDEPAGAGHVGLTTPDWPVGPGVGSDRGRRRRSHSPWDRRPSRVVGSAPAGFSEETADWCALWSELLGGIDAAVPGSVSADEPVYVDRLPVWTDRGYADPDTGVLLPSWEEALDALDADPEAQPVHVVRFDHAHGDFPRPTR